MISEFFLIGSSILGLVGITITHIKHHQARHPIIVPEPSDQAKLIIEMLRSDNDWQKPRTSYGYWEHPTGVRIAARAPHEVYPVQILDGHWQNVRLPEIDRTRVLAERNAFEDRQRDSEQRRLTRELAKRVAAREQGIQPVLAKPTEPTADEDDDLAGEDTSSTGYISYDKRTDTLVASVGTDSLRLDASLIRRYDLPQSNYARLMMNVTDMGGTK